MGFQSHLRLSTYGLLLKLLQLRSQTVRIRCCHLLVIVGFDCKFHVVEQSKPDFYCQYLADFQNFPLQSKSELHLKCSAYLVCNGKHCVKMLLSNNDDNFYESIDNCFPFPLNYVSTSICTAAPLLVFSSCSLYGHKPNKYSLVNILLSIFSRTCSGAAPAHLI